MAPSKPGSRCASKPRKRNKRAKAQKRRLLRQAAASLTRGCTTATYSSAAGSETNKNRQPSNGTAAPEERMDTSSSNSSFDLQELPQSPDTGIVRHHSYLDFNTSDSEADEKNDHEFEVFYNPETSGTESEGELPNLLIEDDIQEENIMSGNRVVEPLHFIKQMKPIFEHSIICTTGKYVLMKEIRNGLSFKLVYFCHNCSNQCIITSEPPHEEGNANKALVWGTISTGIGYSQAEELLGILDIPIMSDKTFRKHETAIEQTWEEHLFMKMKENGEKEKQIAISKGHIKDGIPYISVIGDGGWNKRSYGHGMSSTAGVGVIIGAETNSLLYLGVKNSFCCFCARYKSEGKDPPDHLCYKNYTGPATGMEQRIIVEGFCNSIEQHGLQYLNYIGDGDSSVYNRLQEGVAYGRYIKKTECANHMTRAFSDGLHKLAENTVYSLDGRRVLTENVNGISRMERLIKGVRSAVKEASLMEDQSEACDTLRRDILNSLDHVCGNHENCRAVYCKRKTSDEVNVIPRLVSSNLLLPIKKLLDRLVRYADRLTLNKTTNQAERYMSLVSKFTGGKRIDFSKRGSFKRRAVAAGLCFSAGPSWHSSPWKRMSGKSPGKVLKRLCTKREKARASLRKRYETNVRSRRKKAVHPDSEYGSDITEPDIPAEEFNSKSKHLLEVLSTEVDTEEKRALLENKTIGQHNNIVWREGRLNRLTASNFGAVVRRLDHTPCHNLVKTILYKQDVNTAAIQYGRLHENVALKKYEELQGVTTRKCGLFVHSDTPYLGASPDAAVGSDGIVEIKCFPSIGVQTFEQVVCSGKKNMCLERKSCGLSLKTNHAYYFQIQGQLNITNRKFCDFVAYGENDIFIQRILVDKVMWTDFMLPKLQRFYMQCILPEIIDSRIRRKLKCRDPKYILEAQSAKEAKAKKK